MIMLHKNAFFPIYGRRRERWQRGQTGPPGLADAGANIEHRATKLPGGLHARGDLPISPCIWPIMMPAALLLVERDGGLKALATPDRCRRHLPHCAP